jgi:hypothetical protein
MTALWQRIRAADGAPVGSLGGLPRSLKGLSDFVLADLSARLGEAKAAQLGYAGAGFVRYVEPPPVPVEIERLWALLALRGMELRDAVEAAIEAADPATQDYYRETTLFRRDSAILIAFASGLGMTEQQLDDLFTYAANLKAAAAPA